MFDKSPHQDWVRIYSGYRLDYAHRVYTQALFHHPALKVLLYIPCSSMTWVFQNSSDLWLGKYGDCGFTQRLQLGLHSPLW